MPPSKNRFLWEPAHEQGELVVPRFAQPIECPGKSIERPKEERFSTGPLKQLYEPNSSFECGWIESGFGSEHAGLDRAVAALDARGIEKAGVVSDQASARKHEFRK